MDLQQVMEQHQQLGATGFRFAPTDDERTALAGQLEGFELAAAWLRTNLVPGPNLSKAISSGAIREQIERAAGRRVSHGAVIAAVIADGRFRWKRDERSSAINIGTIAAKARRPELERKHGQKA